MSQLNPIFEQVLTQSELRDVAQSDPISMRKVIIRRSIISNLQNKIDTHQGYAKIWKAKLRQLTDEDPVLNSYQINRCKVNIRNHNKKVKQYQVQLDRQIDIFNNLMNSSGVQ